MTARAEIPAGLRRGYIAVLVPPALAAPLPLFWTDGASPLAIALYEIVLLFYWLRAKAGRPVRLSDGVLNALGLTYLLWLGFEISVLRLGLLRSVSHLLLFTAAAKLASLKRPGEARTALLVLFLLTLASASSSTHVSSLFYFAVMAFLGFRALTRLAVLADFEEEPPERVLRAVPTGGLAAGAIVAAAVITTPLFYALPRLRSPFALTRFRVDDAFSTTLAADRVDLESFGAAKRSDRVVLRMSVEPQEALARSLRLREAVFTEYHGGVWTRNPYTRGGAGPLTGRRDFSLPERRPGQPLAGRVSIDLNLFAKGFLFLPYGATGLELDRGTTHRLPDGVVQLTSNQQSVRYTAGVRRVELRGIGSSAIDPASVPPEIRDYAARLTGDLSDPLSIYGRIRDHFRKDFIYTLDAPQGPGDPLVNFLLRSKAGHCEFFASAAAMMLTARGIPARLVTGSYGGETGFFSQTLVVRGANLHAWVEADIDGKGFSLLDPTPDAGIPPAASRVSVWKRLATLGREIEFFYDRRILGFDSLDQIQIIEAVRQSLSSSVQTLASWKESFRLRRIRGSGVAAALLALAGIAMAVLWRIRKRASLSVATKEYLKLRRLVARRVGTLSPAVPPAEVARLLAHAVPPAREDARVVMTVYCASAFGGVEPDPATVRDLAERMRRLKKLA